MHKEGLYLGFDFGLKRMGVAVGQSISLSATPLAILSMTNGKPIWSEIENLLKEWQPVAVVVGWEEHATMLVRRTVKRFSRELKKRFDNPVYFWDEHLSTREAHSQIAEQKFSTRKQTSPVDDISAKIILESWLRQLRIADLMVKMKNGTR